MTSTNLDNAEISESTVHRKPENGGLGSLPNLETDALDELRLTPEIQAPQLIPDHELSPEPVAPIVVAVSAKLDAVNMFVSARCGEFGKISAMLREDESCWSIVFETRDSDGHSVLHWAALFDATEFIRTSCERSQDVAAWVNGRSNNGQTAFMWACIKGNFKSMKLLYHKFGADRTFFDSLRANSSILAVQHHQYNVLLLLHRWAVQAGDKGQHIFDFRDCSGCTVSHWAAYKGDILMLRLLQYMKADLNMTDNQGMTPLHRATGEGWNECAIFLVDKAGASTTMKSNKNESAIDIAKRLENKQLLLAWDSGACADAKCKSKHSHSGGGPDMLATSPWILPGIFSACLCCTVICFFSDFFKAADTLPALCFVFCAIVSIVLYADLVVSDPGTVPRRPVGNSAVEELQAQLDSQENSGMIPSDLQTAIQRICFTCWEFKDVNRRIKHCATCDACFEGFDHHCGWINNCVGQANHRRFVSLVFSVFTGMVFFLWVSISGVVHSGLPFSDQLWYKPLLIPVWLVHLVVVPWLGLLLLHQFRTIAMNMNTNEMINLQRYSHFWKMDGETRRFSNPFDQGGVVANCMHFWFRKIPSTASRGKYSVIGNSQEIEMAAVV